MLKIHAAAVLALTTLAFSPANAQTAARTDPSDPQALVPKVVYQSPFANYRALADDQVAPWRETNEAVKGAPGHAGHGASGMAGKTSQTKPASSQPAEAGPVKKDAGAHAGHHR